MGPILLVALGVVALIQRGAIDSFMTEVLAEAGEISDLDWLLVAVGWAFMGFCLSLCAISAPSFSLEGKQLWLLRSAPVSEQLLIRVKTWFEVLVSLPCALVSAACLAIAFGMGPLQTAALLAFPIVFLIGHAYFGTLVGLAFVRTDLDLSLIHI